MFGGVIFFSEPAGAQFFMRAEDSARPETPAEETAVLPGRESGEPAGADVPPELDDSPLSEPAPPPFEDGFNIPELTTISLSYFDPRHELVEPESQYPFEGYRQRDFTQPTAIGFYALLLANLMSGDLATSDIPSSDAGARLNRLMDSLLRDQERLGFNGLIPWLDFEGTGWSRKQDITGDQVVLGDNANLSVTLAAASGALLEADEAEDPLAQEIRAKEETFLERQREGYDFLFVAEEGRFRRGWNYVDEEWLGGDNARVDYFGDEFRGAVLFLALRYGYPESVYTTLDAAATEYTLSSGETLETVMPFDGGAFQILWPLLTMPELKDPDLELMHQNFIRIALDHAREHRLPGFLSASYAEQGVYAGNAGIPELSYNPLPRNEIAASLYTLGAAYSIAPAEIEAFLGGIFDRYPGLITDHGLWEGVNLRTGTVIEEQISANVTTFVLGLAGTGPEHMRRYLAEQGLLERLEDVYLGREVLDGLSEDSQVYAWSDGVTALSVSGGEYSLSAENSDSAAIVFSQDNADLSGRSMRLRYHSASGIDRADVEFEARELDGPVVHHRIEGVAILDTSGTEPQELTAVLPRSLQLLSIDKVRFRLSGAALPDEPLSLTVTDLEFLPPEDIA